MSGKQQDFSDFVLAAEPELLRTAYLLTRDRGQAEDLLQTSLAKTYRHWSRVATMDNPRAYVRRAMINTLTSRRRRLMSTEQVLEDVPERTGEDPQTAHAERDEMRRALTQLPARTRAVIVLRYFEDLTEPEIAALMGCTVSTVNTHTSRGLAALRQCFGVERSTDLAPARRCP